MANKSKKSSAKKKKNTPLFTMALVVLALLIVFIVVLVKKDQIISNFKEVNFFGRVFGKTPEFVEKHENLPKKDSNEEHNDTITLKITPENSKSDVVIVNVAEEPKENKKTQEELPATKTAEQPKTVEKPNVEKSSESTKTVEEKKPAPVSTPAMMDLQICFVYIDSQGSVLRKIVKKSVAKTDSPLTTAINTLLKGPEKTKSEEKNCMTLIPSGTKLLSAKVKDGVAFLNFSEDFLINDFGADGYQNQLMQVVYTATAFSTVNSVQFLIEGEQMPYLSEGIWIGSPLARGSF